MAQTALAQRREAVRCPSCNVELEANLTHKQQSLIKELISGKHDSVFKAAEAAGMHPQHAYELLQKPAFVLAQRKELQRKSDKARDSVLSIVALKEKALERLLEKIPSGADMTFEQAGTLAKFAMDAHLVELKVRELIGDADPTSKHASARDHWLRSVKLASRYARIARRATAEQIAERVERWQQRH